MAFAERLSRMAAFRVDRRTVLGVTLAATSALLVLVMTRPPPSTPVLVAGANLPTGVPLADLDLQVRMVTDPEGLVAGDTVGELAAWTLAVPLVAGEPILTSLLRSPSLTAAPDALALEVPAGRAVMGLLAPGDLVDVYVTVARPGAPAETTRVASSVPVVDVVAAQRSGPGVPIGVILAVDDALALDLTAASHAGDIDLVQVGR